LSSQASREHLHSGINFWQVFDAFSSGYFIPSSFLSSTEHHSAPALSPHDSRSYRSFPVTPSNLPPVPTLVLFLSLEARVEPFWGFFVLFSLEFQSSADVLILSAAN
jgi:hypothetical protein